jgi:hypothetical protein
MKTLFIAAICIIAISNSFGQMKGFKEAPDSILIHINEMGRNENPILTQHESDYFDFFFAPINEGFNFRDKKIAFILSASLKRVFRL